VLSPLAVSSLLNLLPFAAFYRLVEVDTRGKADNVHSLHRKLEEQLSRSTYHDGLFDLLYELRDIQLPNNR
jgi:hypothetical protein